MWCSMLHCVAVCAACCSVIELVLANWNIVVRYSMLQRVAVYCSVLHCYRICISKLGCCSVLQYVAICCSVLQCVAALWNLCCVACISKLECCSVTQYIAVCCSVLQCVAELKNLYQGVGILYSKLIRKLKDHYTADFPELVPAPQRLGAQVPILKNHRATTIYYCQSLQCGLFKICTCTSASWRTGTDFKISSFTSLSRISNSKSLLLCH